MKKFTNKADTNYAMDCTNRLDCGNMVDCSDTVEDCSGCGCGGKKGEKKSCGCHHK
ncbi:MAG: hypothetical protein ACRCW2_03260 [Cellulosilyticaceae bacterium]